MRSSSLFKASFGLRTSNKKYILKFTPNNTINTATTFCIYTLYSAILVFLIPNPPVPAVARAVFIASNALIPPSNNKIHSNTVNAA